MKVEKTRFEKLPKAKQVLPKQCLTCGCRRGYEPAITKGIIEFRKENFEVEYERMECPECGDSMLTDEQATQQIKKAVAAYQAKHDLLTAEELNDRRKALGYSQSELVAHAPEISVASLKRIEAGLSAQNKSTDVLIRVALNKLESRKRLERYWAITKEEPTIKISERCILYSSRSQQPNWFAVGFEIGVTTFEGFSTRISSTVNSPARIDISSNDQIGNRRLNKQFCSDTMTTEEQFAMAI